MYIIKLMLSEMIYRLLVNSPLKEQWREPLILHLICAWPNGWANHRDVGDLRRCYTHYDVTVMSCIYTMQSHIWHCKKCLWYMSKFWSSASCLKLLHMCYINQIKYVPMAMPFLLNQIFLRICRIAYNLSTPYFHFSETLHFVIHICTNPACYRQENNQTNTTFQQIKHHDDFE